ncbi:MAG: phospholipase D-like domain-containing protein, partial [Gemmatimonadota bacterium]
MNIALTILATLVGVVLLRNLVPRSPGHVYELRHQYGVRDPQFARDMGQLLGPPLVGGNRITTLQNGDQIFPAMLDAIRSAERSITLETYIYWSGTIGAAFVDALSERARSGVRVHIMLDWLGSNRMDGDYLAHLKAAGAEVVRYHPVRWYTLDRLNNRTHRKLLVVDGRVGFTGGVGIADLWLGDAQDPEHWRDTHYRVEGPAASQFQAAFMDNWLQTRGEVLQGEGYFPALPPVGTQQAQVFKSSSREGSESVRLMYLMAFAAAERSILVANAYFVPDDQVIAELVQARQRGVVVEFIVPGPVTDTQIVRAASRSRWEPLLQAGVRFWEFQP